jgi:hypothetical protein
MGKSESVAHQLQVGAAVPTQPLSYGENGVCIV